MRLLVRGHSEADELLVGHLDAHVGELDGLSKYKASVVSMRLSYGKYSHSKQSSAAMLTLVAP